MLLQKALFHSFLWLSSILFYICTTSSLSIQDNHLFKTYFWNRAIPYFEGGQKLGNIALIFRKILLSVGLRFPQVRGFPRVLFLCIYNSDNTPQTRISQTWHYWHLGMDNSLMGEGAILCILRFSATSQASTLQMSGTHTHKHTHTHTHTRAPSSCDNQNCHQTLPISPGGKLPMVEDHFPWFFYSEMKAGPISLHPCNVSFPSGQVPASCVPRAGRRGFSAGKAQG